MNVQVDVAVWRRDTLPSCRRDADHVADSTHVDDNVITSGAQHRPAEMRDHRAGTAAEKRRLRMWQTAIAMASRACSSSFPSGIFT